MQTIWTNKEIIDGKKVLTLDSDCVENIEAIRESIQIINNCKADYGLLTLWGKQITISKDDTPEEVYEAFKQQLYINNQIL